MENKNIFNNIVEEAGKMQFSDEMIKATKNLVEDSLATVGLELNAQNLRAMIQGISLAINLEDKAGGFGGIIMHLLYHAENKNRVESK